VIYTTFRSDAIPFTVNTAVTEVAAAITWPLTFQTPGGGLQRFEPNDNITLRRIRVWLPFYFVLGSAPAGVVISWMRADGFGGYNIVGLIGSYYIPQACEWVEVDQPSDFPTFATVPPADVQAQLNAQDAPGSGILVSMIGVPAALNTLNLNAYILMSVEHTLPLV
jgi:hypothetical protein